MIKQVPRLVALMTVTDGTDEEVFQAAARAAAEALKHRIGGENASIRIGIRMEDDPLFLLMGQRGEAVSIDSVLEVTLAEDQSSDELITCVEGFHSHFEGLVEPGTTAVLAGTAHLVIEGTGKIFIAKLLPAMYKSRMESEIIAKQMMDKFGVFGAFFDILLICIPLAMILYSKSKTVRDIKGKIT